MVSKIIEGDHGGNWGVMDREDGQWRDSYMVSEAVARAEFASIPYGVDLCLILETNDGEGYERTRVVESHPDEGDSPVDERP